MRSFAALSLLALAGLSTAQDQYTIDPETVKEDLREYWCDQQLSQCPLICFQQPGVETQDTVANDCDPETLEYACTCDNGVSPNITEYTQTMPYFKCTEWGSQCVTACGSDSACADSCRADHPCGAQEPVKPNATASASASSPSQTDSDSPASTDRLGESNDEEPESGGAMAIGASYGTMAFTLAGIFFAFAFL